MTDINDVSSLASPAVAGGLDLFAFKINYNQINNDLNGTIKPLFNGNISETYWRSKSDNILRKYSYRYDDLNRLHNAVYQKPDFPVAQTHSYDENIDYDLNGNITQLNRTGNLDSQSTTIQIDNLTYQYDSQLQNQLINVTDSTNSPAGFKDNVGNATGNDYSYDANGNLTSDQNKNITAITYNHQNLPTKIEFGSLGNIVYIYNAAGIKLKKVVTTSYGLITTTDYLGGYQYQNQMLQFFPTAEGYVNATMVPNVLPTTYIFDYVYNYLDHLGNIRVSYGEDPTSHVLKIIEENHYYPFGLKHNNYNTQKNKYQFDDVDYKLKQSVSKNVYNYKYNGKELQDEFGLNLYDYGFRNYDPAIARWTTIDPLAEKYPSIGGYTYCADNPIMFIDPDGKRIEFAPGTSAQYKKQFAQTVKYLNAHHSGGMLAKLQARKEVILIGALDEGSKGAGFSQSKGKISWNPTTGVKFDDGVKLSPASALNHEVDHALDAAVNPKEHTENSKKGSDSKYDTKEERRVITGSEQETAKNLGEIKDGQVTRTDHEGTSYETTSPTTTKAAPVKPVELQEIIIESRKKN